MTGPIGQGPFERVPVFSEELVIVAQAGHAPIGKARRLLPSTIVSFEPGCPHRARLEAWYARRHGVPQQTIEITSYHAMLGCVAIGMGISLVPRSVLATFPDIDRLSLHPLPRSESRASTDLIWRSGALSPKITALLQLLSPA